MTSGARLTCNYMRIGGVAFDLRPEFEPVDPQVLHDFPPLLRRVRRACWSRTRSSSPARAAIGVLSPEMATNASLSGPMLRGSGIAWDIRKADPYCGYEKYDFEIPIGYQGDSFDRFIVRLAEMRQSLKIIRAGAGRPAGRAAQHAGAARAPSAGRRGVRARRGAERRTWLLRRQRRGPIAVSLPHPRRRRSSISARSSEMTVGGTVADAIVVLGSIDIVVGEVDR